MDESRVIMVDGKRAGWYDKAIFILAPTVRKETVSDNMVDEAERIVSNYLSKELVGKYEKHQKDFKKVAPSTVQVSKKGSTDKTLTIFKVISVVSILLCILSVVQYMGN